MFLITQFIGLAVVSSYSRTNLPYGMQPPQEIEPSKTLISIIMSFAIAITFILILIKYKWKFFIRAWFFVVVLLALAIVFNAILKNCTNHSEIIAILFATPLAFIKIYRPNFLIHNLTEILIYPGIAAVFVPILNWWTIIVLLILISIYDVWAVWHSGIMQKMAKFQMKELKILGGFMVPSISKKVMAQIKKMKKSKSEKPKKIKISLAILGGGDIVFPIIAAGVFLREFGLMPALFVTLGAFSGLTYLFIISKKKFYPAMPFITAGIFLGILISLII